MAQLTLQEQRSSSFSLLIDDTLVGDMMRVPKTGYSNHDLFE